MTTLTRKSPARAHKPFANYFHVVTAQGANKLVFCAGQVAADPPGKVLSLDDFAAQTKMVMDNLKLALAEGGARPRMACVSAVDRCDRPFVLADPPVYGDRLCQSVLSGAGGDRAIRLYSLRRAAGRTFDCRHGDLRRWRDTGQPRCSEAARRMIAIFRARARVGSVSPARTVFRHRV